MLLSHSATSVVSWQRSSLVPTGFLGHHFRIHQTCCGKHELWSNPAPNCPTLLAYSKYIIWISKNILFLQPHSLRRPGKDKCYVLVWFSLGLWNLQNLISKLIVGDAFCQVLSDLILPFLANVLFLGSKDNIKSSSLRIMIQTPQTKGVGKKQNPKCAGNCWKAGTV